MYRGKPISAIPLPSGEGGRRPGEGRCESATPLIRRSAAPSPGGRRALIGIVVALLLLAGCRQKMANQPRYDPLEESNFFPDGMASRPRIPGTVARGQAAIDSYLVTGKIGGQDGDGYPFPITADLMNRGQERFNIYCSECHGRLGDGNGMIPSRGYRRPPSFHTEALRNAKTGHFFDVMTNGFGAMPPYAPQVPAEDRWAIVAYIRALQLSQNGTINDLTPELRAKLETTAPGGAR